MVKRGGKTKKISAKKSSNDKKVENILVENFVALQKVMTTLSEKFDKLTNQISGLLEIFEKSAETLAKKDFRVEQRSEETAKIIEGIKNISEQNKTIARGLTLLHEHSPEERSYSSISNTEIPKSPSIPEAGTTNRKSIELEDYGNEISDKLRRLRQG